jgi:hypothetical protein
MAEPSKIIWTGKSGVEYTYYIYKWETTFKAEPGNYCFAKETKPNFYTPLYFGETGDLSTRFADHHKWDCAERQGATHIHVHTNSVEKVRRAEEADLVAKWSPPCNG